MASVPGTHCRSGRHEFTPENTIERPQGRTCRPCAREKWLKPPPPPRACVVCDTTFQPRDKGARYAYCSKPCHNVFRTAKKYGLTVADYRARLERQDGRCLICDQKTALVIDHSHSSGKVRGLLCLFCNSGLGYFFDAPERLLRAAAYLKETE